jgi:hypothetical protein
MKFRDSWDLGSIPYVRLAAEWMRRMRAKRSGPPTPKLLAPCKWCGDVLGARERRAHEPACLKNPRNISTNR